MKKTQSPKNKRTNKTKQTRAHQKNTEYGRRGKKQEHAADSKKYTEEIRK